MRRRSNRRAQPASRPLASDPAVGGNRLRAALARTRVQAALLFLLLLAAYWANGDILPGNDPIASVRLAGKLVSKHRLVFTPEEDPFMFDWHLRTPQGERHVHFHSWRSSVNGEPVRPAYERGDLSEPEANYYLMKTRYPNVYANRYGVGAALFAVPFVAAVYPFARDLYDRPSADILWFTSKLAASCAVAASAVLLFLAIRMMTGAFWPSAMVAALSAAARRWLSGELAAGGAAASLAAMAPRSCAISPRRDE